MPPARDSPMKFTPTHYMTIAGTEVLVKVETTAEAKAAVKELRHAKREYALLRRALVKQQRRAEADHAKTEKAKAQARRRKGVMGSIARVRSLFESDAPPKGLAEIEREIHKTDEIIHNIESCTLQIQGRLIKMT